MHWKRFLHEDCICLDLQVVYPDPVPAERCDGFQYRRKCKACVIRALGALFGKSGAIRNESRFLRDFMTREKAGSTAIGRGIAIPHVRSMQPREPVVIFARSREGLEYLADDAQPVRLFFGITAPPYQEKIYLDLYRHLSLMLREDWLLDGMMTADDPGEIIRFMAMAR